MIEKLTYINEHGDRIEFSPCSTFHVNIAAVKGLSDIRQENYSITSMGQSGDTLVGERIKARDIEIVGDIKDRNRTHEHKRTLTRILNPEFAATLVYERGSYKRQIRCKLDGDNALHFPKKQVYQPFVIQLFCASPYWHEEHESRNDIASWLSGFEFPEPDGLELDDDEGWEIERREPSLIVNVINQGDVCTGMRVVFRALGAVTEPSLFNVNTTEFILFKNFSMLAGDVLTVSTGYGEKAVTLLRNGIITEAFRALDIDSTYMQLDVGDNLFRYDAKTNLENLEVSIYHKNNYLGV